MPKNPKKPATKAVAAPKKPKATKPSTPKLRTFLEALRSTPEASRRAKELVKADFSEVETRVYAAEDMAEQLKGWVETFMWAQTFVLKLELHFDLDMFIDEVKRVFPDRAGDSPIMLDAIDCDQLLLELMADGHEVSPRSLQLWLAMRKYMVDNSVCLMVAK